VGQRFRLTTISSTGIIPTMTTISTDLTEDQLEAAKRALASLRSGQPLITIGGPAGTGKTTLIKYIRAHSPLKLAFIAYTGKAVSTLIAKGVEEAQTMHSLIYRLVEDHDEGGEVAGWVLKESQEIDCAGIVVDEASMIGKEYLEDLMSLGLPIVAVGDPGQLPPVSKDDVNLVAKPDIFLSQIHRQAEGSGIIKFATSIREDSDYINNLQEYHSEDLCVIPKSEARFEDADIYICGFNKTRVALNKSLRKRKGYKGDMCATERIIALSNDTDLGVYNGLMGTVIDIQSRHRQKVYPKSRDIIDTDIIVAKVLWDGEQTPRLTRLSTYCLGHASPEWAVSQAHRGVAAIVDYAYAITCHKAQGSEWDRVVVMNEVYPKFWPQQKWGYTAGTRAAKRLIYGVSGL
jgi:exodeoxyribonuclease-5